MRCVVGLGNPGRRYRLTRHNAGFLVVERVGKSLQARRKRKTRTYDARVCSLGGSDLLLVRPLTYMNRSGVAVDEVLERFGVSVGELLVVCDDASLPLGKVRLRKKGSSGGHKGLQSLIDELGTQAFERLRVGIGEPEADESLEDYVLERPGRGERELFDRAVELGAEALLVSLERDFDFAMNKFN